MIKIIFELILLGILPAGIAFAFSYYFFRKRTEYSDIFEIGKKKKLIKGFRYLIGISVLFMVLNITIGVFDTFRVIDFHRDNKPSNQSLLAPVSSKSALFSRGLSRHWLTNRQNDMLRPASRWTP